MATFKKLSDAITAALWEETEGFLKAFVEEVTLTSEVVRDGGVTIEIHDETNCSYCKTLSLRETIENSFDFTHDDPLGNGKSGRELYAEAFEKLAKFCREEEQ